MSLRIYNSLTRQKEEFKPLHEGAVGMYVCGPTVYSHSHIGHAKSYISFDVIVRYLRSLGYSVLYVQNITDVGHLLESGEDRMLKQSKIEKVHPMQVAETITKSYFEDMDALGNLRPDISPRASGHIVEQIEMVKKLVDKSYAYVVNGSVYFDVHKFEGYGKLSGRTLEETMEGTRVQVRSEKKNPEDFALWKKAEPEHIMRWSSPWGEGFPGWHIECSAMSMKYLGETFDIHGGGLDNQFPHHECEIAQSEGATGKPFAKYWIHNNLVTVNGQKMSKSLGNFVTLKDAVKNYNPLVIRLFILQSHYRSTLDFSNEALDGAKSGWEKLRNTYTNIKNELNKAETSGKSGTVKVDVHGYRSRFLEAMNDDFNTPQALGVLFDLSRDMNQALMSEAGVSKESLITALDLFEHAGNKVLAFLGLGIAANLSPNGASEPELIQLFIELRNAAKSDKNYALSDRIRESLKKLGVLLEDKKDGTTVWKKS